MRLMTTLLGLILSQYAFGTGGGSSAGLANPATLNCIKLGGVSAVDGSKSNCEIEEWQLFREMSKLNLVKPHQYPSDPNGPIGMPNPASVNCIDIKGQLKIVTGPGGQSGICIVDEWDLYKVINPVQQVTPNPDQELKTFDCTLAHPVPDAGVEVSIFEGGFTGLARIEMQEFMLTPSHTKTENFYAQPEIQTRPGAPFQYRSQEISLMISNGNPMYKLPATLIIMKAGHPKKTLNLSCQRQ